MTNKGSKRITRTTLLNYAKLTGIVGTPLGIILLLFLFNTGIVTVEDSSSNTYCGYGDDVLKDTDCWIELNQVCFDNDVFIYPMNGSEIVNAQPSDSIIDFHLYRSWGDRWEEIKLNDTCKSTRCGGKRGTTDNKYSFAFREDKCYNLRVELKKEWNSTINWSINPIGVFSSITDYKEEYIIEVPIYEIKEVCNYYKENKTKFCYNLSIKIGYEPIIKYTYIDTGLNIDGINYMSSILQLNTDGEYEAYEYLTTNPSVYCPTCRCFPYEIKKGICRVIK